MIKHLMKQQTSMRLTMNLEGMLHIILMNQSPPKMSKEDSYHPKQTIWLHSHNNSHRLRKAVKKTPSSTAQESKEKGVLKAILQDQQTKCTQGPAPTAPTSQTGGPPQAPPVNNQNRDHQDPPECNGTTNGSTRAPANGKGPGAAKAKKKAPEPHPVTMASTGPATQPSDSLKNTIICSGCGKSGHWSRNCSYYNFCDFCRVTTHSTHMCRANRNVDPVQQSVYTAGKTNHNSAYCRYRPRDNWEEPRHTPDALKTGATRRN